MIIQKKFICEFCGKIFLNSHAKAGHVRSHKVNSSEIMKNVWKDSIFREKRKNALESVQDAEYWERVCKGVQKHWDNHPERKKILSERLSKEWKDPNGKRRKIFSSKEHREKMSNVKREQSKNPEYIKKLSDSHKNWFNNLSKKEKSDFLERFTYSKKSHRKYTTIELLLYNGLIKEGLKRNLHMQYRVSAKTNPYFIDLCYPKYKLAIEAYGDYWHRNPEIYKKTDETLVKIVNHDYNRIEELKKKGFKVLCFFETDIKKNLQNCIDLTHKELLLKHYYS